MERTVVYKFREGVSRAVFVKHVSETIVLQSLVALGNTGNNNEWQMTVARSEEAQKLGGAEVSEYEEGECWRERGFTVIPQGSGFPDPGLLAALLCGQSRPGSVAGVIWNDGVRCQRREGATIRVWSMFIL